MQYTRLVVLTIFILTIERGSAINLRSVLSLYADHPGDENNNNGVVRTKLSTVEKVLKTILLPIEAVENTTQIIEKGVNNIISKLPPSLRNHIEGNVSNGKRGFGDVLNLLSDRFRAIYPGTLWCGAGDIAENEQDLGLFERTDACCRDHDNCFNGINAGEEKDGLLNNGIFTRSHCSCDSAFNECLKNVHSIVATKIGITYFEILSPQCFADDYPIINCRRYSSSGLIDEKCIKYDQDYKAEKKLQWFDNPIF